MPGKKDLPRGKSLVPQEHLISVIRHTAPKPHLRTELLAEMVDSIPFPSNNRTLKELRKYPALGVVKGEEEAYAEFYLVGRLTILHGHQVGQSTAKRMAERRQSLIQKYISTGIAVTTDDAEFAISEIERNALKWAADKGDLMAQKLHKGRHVQR